MEDLPFSSRGIAAKYDIFGVSSVYRSNFLLQIDLGIGIDVRSYEHKHTGIIVKECEKVGLLQNRYDGFTCLAAHASCQKFEELILHNCIDFDVLIVS